MTPPRAASSGKRASAAPSFSASPEDLRRALLAWYDASARALPWRSPPGAPPPAPWPTLVSEIMLQQTTVATVLRRFDAFLARFPSPAAMAEATEEEVFGAWSGLGYYARARRLRQAAAELARLPAFPRTASAWRALPGIGEYTAAAVASICFGEPALALDANLARVLARLSNEERPIEAKSVRDALGAFGRTLLDWTRPGDFNQALMDLGATVCVPGAEPRCALCPLATLCAARAAGREGSIPAPKIACPSEAKAHRRDLAFAIMRDGAAGGVDVLLWRRPDARPYAGLWELPTWRLGPTDTTRTPDDPLAPATAFAWLRRELGATSAALRSPALAPEATRHAITIYKVELGLLETRYEASDSGNASRAEAGVEFPLPLAGGVAAGRWTRLAEAPGVAQATPQRKLLAALAKRLADR
jgi:A/G-specific adenine glycosylase